MSIYFVRHGESRANEQNLFAGRHDSPLTELGRRQARSAGRAVRRGGLRFDEIHVSPLSRAYETAQILAREAGLTEAAQAVPNWIVSAELIERDFGTLSEQSKSLVKKAFGHAKYEEMFHRAGGCPPGGETFETMFERTRAYYEQVLLPSSRAGRSVLVVAHKYIVEMFALLAADLGPQDYFDFKIPNSKPNRLEDLRQHVLGASAAAQAAAEKVEIHLPALMLGAACVGGALRQLGASVLDHRGVFELTMSALLAINSFIALLRLESTVLRQAGSAIPAAAKGMVVRLGAALLILVVVHSPAGRLAALFFLLPPAMTAPTLSLLWDGDFFFASQLTVILSLAVPIALLLAAAAAHFAGFSPGIPLVPYLVTFAGAVLLPGFVAQIYRHRRPIQAGAIATNYGWIGGAAMIPLAFLSAYHFTPSELGSVLRLHAAQGLLFREIGFVAVLFVAIRLSGNLASRLLHRDPRAKFDANLCQVVPNLFLWFTFLPSQSIPSLVPALMNLAFFTSIAFEERQAVLRFARKHGLRPLAAPFGQFISSRT